MSKNYRLRLLESDLDALHLHAERVSPLESVALLFGNVEHTDVIVKRIELVENSSKSTTRFSVDPVVQYQLLIDAEKRGEEMVGIYHSHPASAKPSSIDKKNMRLNPVVWLIASKNTSGWESKAFILDSAKIIEISIDLML